MIKAREGLARVQKVQLDNAQYPGLMFVPYASGKAQPDPRGYDIAKALQPTTPRPSQRGSDENLALSSIRHLGALLGARQISSVELTKFYLDRLRRYDPLLECVVTFTDDLALRQAERADRHFAQNNDRGPLQGIPWGMKDILPRPGYPTTWGARHYLERVIDVKAAVAERLEQAGAVLVAKLATNPFAGGDVLWYRGVTCNPWNPRGGPRSPAAARKISGGEGRDSGGGGSARRGESVYGLVPCLFGQCQRGSATPAGWRRSRGAAHSVATKSVLSDT
jgi:hypothetical protein